MQENGISFTLGTTLNPTICNAVPLGAVPTIDFTGNGTVVYNATATSTTGSAVTALTFAVPNNTSLYINIIYSGKLIGSGFYAQYGYNMSVVRNGSATPILNSISTTVNGLPAVNGSGWFSPNIPTISAGRAVITTGFYSSGAANWTINVQVLVVSA
jgi:hypothetical protein